MTARIGYRFAPTRVVSTALAETRIAARAVPRLLRWLLPIAAWAAASIILGTVVGLAAVILPPMGAFGIVALLGLILLWVMPEMPLVFPGLIRKLFFVMLVVNLCVPTYYMVQFAGLPWISIRRLSMFALILPFLLAIASSSGSRREILDRLRSSPGIVACALGFLFMAFISILTSRLPQLSMSALSDAVLTWYVTFFAALFVVKSKEDAILVLKIICFCSIFITMAGMLEFHYERRIFLDIFPKQALDAIIDSNPSMADFLDPRASFRNGLYRSASVFMTALSFGEYEIIIIPIGLFFALHREKFIERCLGWAVVITGMIGIYVSGSRGGYVGFLTSTAAFVAAWSVRKAQTNRISLAPAFVGLAGGLIFTALLGLIMFWGRAHNMVLGGGAEASSTDARWVQWAAASPLVHSNPITGHGFATGGSDIGMSIDSYIISLLLETGIPGFVFFAGVCLLPIWFGMRSYIFDLTESGALAGALGCSFVAFTSYRIVLSQRENNMLAFLLLALVVSCVYEYKKSHVAVRQRGGSQGRLYSGPQVAGLG